MSEVRLGHQADDLRSYRSPRVQRLLADHGLDPAAVPGSGLAGRITSHDVADHLARRGDDGVADAPADPPGDRSPVPPGSTGRPGSDGEHVPFSRIRRRTADHMVQSLAAAAHALVVTDVDYGAVEAARSARKEAFREREGIALTFLPFVARAVVEAIARFPHVNATVGVDELVVHRRVDLGIAVDLGFEGLVVPVVRGAEDLRVRGLARRIADVADRARAGRLRPDDVSGGTFTLTNPGGHGTFVTAPIINHPQAAILSTDSVRMRPVAVALPDGTWGVAVHPVGHLSLSFDHRALDGAYAASFLDAVRDGLETVDWTAEL
jgi:2-oxoglutarate dehydrogenase E2 component (dihydrolipoamide succinyltransferase)